MILKNLFDREQKTKNEPRILDQEIINKIENIGIKESENKDADVKIWVPKMMN